MVPILTGRIARSDVLAGIPLVFCAVMPYESDVHFRGAVPNFSRSALPTLGLLVAIGTAWSCAYPGSTVEDEELQPEVEREITLHVRNQNYYDATLYAVDGGYRTRLGFITGNTERTFKFRWPKLDLRVDIHLLSVGSHLTESLPVLEGDILDLWIEPDLHLKIRRDG